MANLIKNGGFEEGEAYWLLYNGAMITQEQKFSGIYSLFIKYGVDDYQSCSQLDINIPTGDYVFTFKFKLRTLDDGIILQGNVRTATKVDWFGVEMKNGNPLPFATHVIIPLRDGWYRYSFDLSTVMGVGSLRFFGYKEGLYIDDVYLGTSPPAPPTIIEMIREAWKEFKERHPRIPWLR